MWCWLLFIYVLKANSEVLQQHSFLFPFCIFRWEAPWWCSRQLGLHLAAKTLPETPNPVQYIKQYHFIPPLNCKRSSPKSGWTLINHLKIKKICCDFFLFVFLLFILFKISIYSGCLVNIVINFPSLHSSTINTFFCKGQVQCTQIPQDSITHTSPQTEGRILWKIKVTCKTNLDKDFVTRRVLELARDTK